MIDFLSCYNYNLLLAQFKLKKKKPWCTLIENKRILNKVYYKSYLFYFEMKLLTLLTYLS